MTTVAVTAASGKTGRAVTAALRAAGLAARPLARADADLDTGAGLDDGLAGCDAVYLLAPNVHPDEPGLVGRVLAAARRQGVGRVVYHSVASPYAPAMPHHVDKAVAEDLVRRSGLAWTVLQPCAYVQNLLPGLQSDPPGLSVPYRAEARFNLVDLADVAWAAAAVLVRDGGSRSRHLGATYELGGPDAVSVRDVAAAAARVLGADVPVQVQTPERWAREAGASLSPDARARLLAMFASYDQHGFLAGSLALEALLGRAPANIHQVVLRSCHAAPDQHEPAGS